MCPITQPMALISTSAWFDSPAVADLFIQESCKDTATWSARVVSVCSSPLAVQLPQYSFHDRLHITLANKRPRRGLELYSGLPFRIFVLGKCTMRIRVSEHVSSMFLTVHLFTCTLAYITQTAVNLIWRTLHPRLREQ